MAAPRDIPLRAARDRLIDLLGIGDSYPLSDLEVPGDLLKVPFGGTAKIAIEDAQLGVRYQLCDPDEVALGTAYEDEGKGAELLIESPAVAEDVAYRIRATKIGLPGKVPQAERFLTQGAPVKVGIDSKLPLRIVNAPPLDPAHSDPQPGDPYLVAYGASAEVEVGDSQEGVDYSLILDQREVSGLARAGNLGPIVLPTGPLAEDTVVQVRATKRFLAAGREDETVVLESKLYLKVRANPALTVSIEGAPIVDYGGDATIKVAATQKTAHYVAYACPVADADYVRDAAAAPDLAPVAGKPGLQVRKPARPDGAVPAGYVRLGDAAAGGSDVKLAANALTEDAIVIVQAIKQHRVEPGEQTIASAVWLEQAAVVLVRPDPARALRLRAQGGSLQVHDGQPGVFYYVTPEAGSGIEKLPAYFHKRDPRDAAQNKGIGQLGVEIDFAVAADPGVRPPLLDLAQVNAERALSLRAVKAQTGVDVNMARGALLVPVPVVRAGAGKIIVAASNAQDLHQLNLDGSPLGTPLPGSGTDLVLDTPEIAADTVFEVVATRAASQGMPVERVARVTLLARPDAALAVAAQLDTVAKDAATGIVVRASQRGVDYQLMAGSTAVGTALPGDGGDLVLPTGPIVSDTTFSVAATRAGNRELTSVLQQQATVKLAAAAGDAS